MNEDKGFSSLFKIVIIAGLLILVVVMILIYSKNLDEQIIVEKQNDSGQVQGEKIVVDYDELVKEYKNDLVEAINAFNGDYQNLQEQIVKITVPSGFQELHLQLVLALNPVLYEENESLTKQRLQDITSNNDWLQPSLEKIILNN